MATEVTRTVKPHFQTSRPTAEELAAFRERANAPHVQAEGDRVWAGLNRAGFGKRHVDAPSIDAWQPTDALHRIVARVKIGATVGVAGNFGRGKTQLACEVCRWWLNTRRGQPVYMTAATLMERLKAAWSGEGDDPRALLRKSSLLVVDDIQNEYHTDTWRIEFGNFMDWRYANVLPTLLIANWTKADFAKHVGQRITSRISEGGGIIELVGIDRRTENAQ